jgi:GH15 family glucan-1,4-alpha-glucosidase
MFRGAPSVTGLTVGAHRTRNDVGLLAEEVEPATDQLPGNIPQAFSHSGLVNAAWAITEGEARRRA